MTDPLDVLRDPPRPVDPDPGFAAALRERLERLVLGPRDETEETPMSVTADTAPAPLTPYLAVPDAAAALEFYAAAFGGTPRGEPITMPDGRIGHAEIIVGGSLVMLADEFPEMGLRAPAAGAVSVSLHLEVADPDAVVDRAVGLGATLERAVTESPHGRGGVVLDPAGHRWMVSRSAPGAGVRPGDLAYASLWTRDPAAAALLGEVEVAVHRVPHADGHPEEAVHPRVPLGHAHRRGVLAEVREPQRLGLHDELADEALALRRVAEQARAGVRVQPDVDEPGQRPVRREHAEAAVAGVDEVHGGLHDPLERGLQLEARRDGEHGVEQALDAVAGQPDLAQPLLDLAEQLVQAQAGEHRARSVVLSHAGHGDTAG